MTKQEFRDYLCENYSTSKQHIPLAWEMLDETLDTIEKARECDRFHLLSVIFPYVPQDILKQAMRDDRYINIKPETAAKEQAMKLHRHLEEQACQTTAE